MGCIEIILEDIQKKYLDEIIGGMLKFDMSDIISSHFFDKKYNRDMEYRNIRNLEDYFYECGTGSLFLERATMEIELEKVLIVISCDEDLGDITINFSEDQFKICKSTDLKGSIKRLIQTLYKIQISYHIKNIIVGYEPAEDDDMKMIELNQNCIKICNEGILQSSFVYILHNAVREILL